MFFYLLKTGFVHFSHLQTNFIMNRCITFGRVDSLLIHNYVYAQQYVLRILIIGLKCNQEQILL